MHVPNQINGSEWLVVVPARLGSTRLPEKPLQDLGGKSLIERVYLNLQTLSKAGLELIIATDSQKILDHCKTRNIPAAMTKVEHVSGSDRCAELARNSTAKYILNVQGDEPFIDCNDLLAMASAFARQEHCAIATLYHEESDHSALMNPNNVKVVMNKNNHALYFSRAAIPHDRDEANPSFNKHLGTYAYKRDALLHLSTLRPTPYELREKLEQLRALEHGYSILMHRATSAVIGIDTPEDLERARAKFV